MSNKNKHIDFYDETLRDGPQSLWGMRMTMGMVEAVAEEIDQAGYEIIMFHLNPVYFQIAVRKKANSSIVDFWGFIQFKMLLSLIISLEVV